MVYDAGQISKRQGDLVDVKEFAHELKAVAENERNIRVKLGHVHQAMAAGFGYRTFAGMQADASVTGNQLAKSMFEKAYFDARLTELIANESKPNKKHDSPRESLWT